MNNDKLNEYLNNRLKSKTELASQKVELALDSQLKDISQKAQSIFNDGKRDARQEIANAASKIENSLRDLKRLQKEVDNAYADGKRKAKELGVDLDNTSVGKNFKQAFNDVNDYVISSQDIVSKLMKIKV